MPVDVVETTAHIHVVAQVEWLAQQAEGQTHGVTTDNEYLPIFGSADGNINLPWITNQTNDALAVEAYHLGDDVYVGGGFNFIDWAWDDSADTPYWLSLIHI